MINSATHKIVEYFVNNRYIPEEKQEYCTYGLTVKFEQLISFGVLAMVAALLQRPVGFLMYYCFIKTLRRHTGGYHAKSYIGCLTVSTLSFILVVLLEISRVTALPEIYGPLYIVSLLILYRYAPVNHPNYSAAINELSYHRTKTRVVLFIQTAAIVIMLLLRVPMAIIVYAIYAPITIAVNISLAKVFGQDVIAIN